MHLNQLLLICQWYIGLLSVIYWSTVSDMLVNRWSNFSHVYIEYQVQWVGSIAFLLTDSQPILGELSAKCQHSVSEVSMKYR